MKKIALPLDVKGVHIHFVGIKGTGMAALVEILFSRGAVITGSDVAERFYTDEILEKLGICALPFSESNITDSVQYVVYSSAYSPQKNPDLIAAMARDIPCMLYTEALGSYSETAFSVGICGVHGKTSTTGLTGTVLKQLDLPFQVLAGSVINSFGNRCTFTSWAKGKKDGVQEEASRACADTVPQGKHYFVAETCEYQRHFMSFCPKIIVLTSVESDHQDYYPTFADIQNAFIDYICKLPQNGTLIFCADDAGASETAALAAKKRGDIRLVPYGTTASGDYALSFDGVGGERNRFSLGLYKNLALKVPGRHEVLDATAAVAVSAELLRDAGKNPADYSAQVAAGLMEFSGGKRRSELVGSARNKNGDSVVVIDDYGHHPTAIRTTLQGYREFYAGRKIIVDFMSHTYSRTQALLDEFATSFTGADQIILHKIYSSARENAADFSITGRTLYEKTCAHFADVHYFEEILDATPFALEMLDEPLDAKKYPDGYLFVTMGAGDNWKLGREVLKALDAQS